VRTATSLGLSETPPVLAQLVSASPVDAAVHDAYGRLHQLNAFDTLSQHFCNRDLSTYLDDRFRGEFADRYTLRAPASSLPLYHLVGALDPLTPEDAGHRPSDSLPWTLGEWILADQLTHLKIKLNGDQLDWDVERVLAIERVALQTQQQRGCTEWFYSCDFNEKCRSADYVVEFLRRIESVSVSAFRRIQYIEQPTSRNLQAADAPDMHAAAAVKPVVIDEALISYESLLMARDQGYSGIALKACKGQSESILMAAAAQKFGMFLCVQDLTCPGASFLHSASLAAHIPGVAAVEGNSRQYCPAANAEWSARLPAAFLLRNGRIDTSGLNGVGLGFY
jgi:L-alanine-DL-glutamate epimerase-like enolase superfamily enzyme